MVLKLMDKNNKIYTYRDTQNGAILIKGKRQIYLIFRSVNSSKKAKQIVAKYSFNKLFLKSKKNKLMGNNVGYIKF